MPKVKTTPAPRGMGRLIANANGTFTLRYWANGKQAEETFPAKADATDRQAEIWQAKRAGAETVSTRGRGDIPFTQACAAWIERSPDRGESTKVNYRCTLKHLTGPLAGKSLKWVATHPADIQALITSLPSSYRKRAKTIITGCLNTAQDDGDIAGHRINRRNVRAGKEAPVKQAPDFARYPDIDDRVAKMALEIDPRYALMVHLGRYAGLRIGESLGLHADDIVTRNGRQYLRVTRQRTADGRIAEYVKTAASRREVPLGHFLAGRLSEAATDAQGYYFPSQWRRTVYDIWDKARDAAGLPEWFTSHDLRHLFASTLLTQGMRLDLVSKWIGHTDVKLTAWVYAHAMAQDEDRVRELL